jgi:hypothetical protein
LDTFNTVNLLYHIKEHYFQVYWLASIHVFVYKTN